MKYQLKFHFFRILSLITPKLIQTQRLENIENNAKIIADKKNLPFLIKCKILEDTNQKPKSFTSIGFSYQYEQMIDGKYNIYIYPQNGMASKQELIKTMFHEYGHFIDYCTRVNTKQPLKNLHNNRDFPIYYDGTYKEDFAELFAWYMMDLISLNNETSSDMDTIIQEGVSVLSDDKMKREIDLKSI